MIATVIAVLVFIAALVQTGYCLYFFIRISRLRQVNGLPSSPDGHSEPAQLPVSVIVCAKNEGEHLRQNLPSLLEQHYHNAAGFPCFEVIVVNDQSTDHSAAVLREFQEKYPRLRVITIPPEEQRLLPGKKFALGKAVGAATYEYLLMTDADCSAASGDWITHMAAPFRAGKEIVAGYGGFYKRKGWLNLFIRLETMHTYLQYLTYNLAGLPYMAVGRNLACKKELLMKAQQDPLWTQTASGDDDLLIRICAGPGNMTVNTLPASFTWSEAKSTTGSWISQKQRHFSTGKLYRKNIQLLLGGYALSHALFWGGLFLLFLCPAPRSIYNIVLIMSFLRCMIWWGICSGLSDMLTDRKIKWYWPLFDFCWLWYNFIFAPYIFWKNKKQWT